MLTRSLIAITAGSALVAAGSAFAQNPEDTYDGTLLLLDATAWGGDELGGPFEVDQDPSAAHPGLGQFGAADGNFITFCMESDEIISQDIVYDFRYNTETVGNDENDPLDERTAYLYTLFSEGTLDEKFNEWSGSTFDFEYLETLSGEVFQDALWQIEEEVGFDYRNQAFSEELVAFADEGVSEGGEWFGKGIGRVRVANVFLDGENQQDVLTFVPLPAPVALAFFGLAGAGLIGRRRRNAAGTASDAALV